MKNRYYLIPIVEKILKEKGDLHWHRLFYILLDMGQSPGGLFPFRSWVYRLQEQSLHVVVIKGVLSYLPSRDDLGKEVEQDERK